MASPQIEHGYAKIAKELLRALARARLTPAERGCVDCLIDATYGWSRKWAQLGHRDYAEYTGYAPKSIRHALSRLRQRNIFESDSAYRPLRWRLQKDYDRWSAPGQGGLTAPGGGSLTAPAQGHTDGQDPGASVPGQGSTSARALYRAGEGEGQTLQEASDSDAKASGAGDTIELAQLSAEANEIVKLVMRHGLNGVRPPDWGIQHRVAVSIVKTGLTRKEVEKACLGLKSLRRGRPFDVKILKSELSVALAEYGKLYPRQVEDKLDAENRRKEAALRREGDCTSEVSPELSPSPLRELSEEAKEKAKRDAQRWGVDLEEKLN